jgi:hypothetical protein
MHVSDRDLYNPNVMRDGMHDWVMANHRMAAILRDRGYHAQYVFSLNSGHVDGKVRAQTLPQALEWVWRGYAAATPAAATTSALEVLTLATGERQVAYRGPGRMESPHFSPDGAALYYNHDGRIKRVALGAPAAPVTVDTGALVRCNNDHGLSPDGTQLVVSDLTETGKSLMYLLPVAGGTPRRVAVGEPAYWHGWSPDGSTLTYGAGREGNYDVYTVPVAGGPEKRLTTSPGNDNGPDYSADGHWIYFHSNRTGSMQVWRIHPDGSGEEQVTRDTNYNWFPHPSPDGKWIVYLSTPTVPDTGHPSDTEYVLRLIPASGGPARDIAKFFGGQGSLNVPCWSRDSTRLAFTSLEPASRP